MCLWLSANAMNNDLATQASCENAIKPAVQHSLLQVKSVPDENGANNIKETASKTIVIVAWYESLAEVPNLLYFIEHAVPTEVSGLLDFLFIDTTPGGSAHIPMNHPNVRVIRRPNVGFDMRSYKVALLTISKADYVNFVLMNGSVRGPFLGQFPSATNFVSPFARLLQGNVHLVGTTVNCLCASAPCHLDNLHLQSMFLVTDRIGIDVINSTLPTMENISSNKNEAIWGPHGEIKISQNILKAGYGIAALQMYWRDNDFQNSVETSKRCERFANLTGGKFTGDPYYALNDVDPVSLSLKDVDPEEVVMFKASRPVAIHRLAYLSFR